MIKTIKLIRCDGWTLKRRTAFLGALRVSGKVGKACAWAGMLTAGAYALAKREPDFSVAWNAALAARDEDRPSAIVKPLHQLSDATLLRRLGKLQTRLDARPRGIVAQQNKRWA